MIRRIWEKSPLQGSRTLKEYAKIGGAGKRQLPCPQMRRCCFRQKGDFGYVLVVNTTSTHFAFDGRLVRFRWAQRLASRQRSGSLCRNSVVQIDVDVIDKYKCLDAKRQPR